MPPRAPAPGDLPSPADRRWRPADAAAGASSISPEILRELAIGPVLARLLARRGLVGREAIRDFLEPKLDALHDPFALTGVRAVVDRLRRAVEAGETILIFGDYDVDGLTASVQLRAALHRVGAAPGTVEIFIPHRLEHGYGLRVATVESEILPKRPGVLITVDCGISAVEGVRRAVEAGIDVIVTDHHLVPDQLPAGCLIVNPKQPGCDYPNKELCGAGVAFKIVQALEADLPGKVGPIESYLRVAALGTVADMVPLLGENRAIARLGTRALAGAKAPGLRALMKSLKLEGKAPSSWDLGFRIGPRLNAAGRVDVASRALALFETKDTAVAEAVVEELERLNRERQELERRITGEARGMVLERFPGGVGVPAGLILASERWHPGVLGISASRIAREFHRPTILLALEPAEGLARGKGSGRSIPEVSIHACLGEQRELLAEFGGHDAAVGLTLVVEPGPSEGETLDRLRRRVEELETRFAATVRARHDHSVFAPELAFELELTLAEAADPKLLDDLARLEPTGQGNPRPLFVARGVAASRSRAAGKSDGRVGELGDGDGGRLRFVAWDVDDAGRALLDGQKPVDVAFQLDEDDWNGRRQPQARILDLRPAVDRDEGA